MSTHKLLHIIQNIAVEVACANIVEYNPVRELHNMTAMVGYKMMKEWLVTI